MTQQSPWWCFYFPRPLIQAQLSSINIFSLHNMFRHSGPDHVRHTTGKFLWCFSSTSQKVKVKRSEISSKLRLQRTVKILSNSFKKWSPPGQYLSFSTVDHIFTRQTTVSLHPATSTQVIAINYLVRDLCSTPPHNLSLNAEQQWPLPSSAPIQHHRPDGHCRLHPGHPVGKEGIVMVAPSPSWLWCWWTTCW